MTNPYGNVGDQLITQGTIHLFQQFDIPFRSLRTDEIRPGHWPNDITILAEPGGGNVGTRSGLGSPKRRQVLSQMPGPKIILPQTVSDGGEDLAAFDTVFVRDETSLKLLGHLPDVRLVPDMALCLQFPQAKPTQEEGVFYRTDIEKLLTGGIGDPVSMCQTTQQYLELAGSYKRILTNRLHFGLAAMMQGVDVVLRPCSYHKVTSIYQTWLTSMPNVSYQEADSDS